MQEIYKLVRRQVSHYGPLFMLGVTAYVLGVGLKFVVIGPVLIRFYLSDLGAPFAASYAFFLPMWRSAGKSSYFAGLDWDERWFMRLRFHRITLILGFCAAVIYELAAGYMHGTGRVEKELKAAGVGRFEWWDVLCYVLATAIGLVILHFWRRQIQRDKLVLDEEIAEQAALIKAAKRAAQKERRKKRQQQPGRNRRRR